MPAFNTERPPPGAGATVALRQRTFSGQQRKAVLAQAGIRAATKLGLEAPILATRIDGEVVHRRKKVLLWQVPRYDDNPIFRSAGVHARSIWQVVRIEAAAA